MRLTDNKFLEVIDSTPLVAIDLIIWNTRKEVLLGKRKNQPAKGYWFVPGGRIRKNERIQLAFERIIRKETGITFPFERVKPVGNYDHIYDDNFAGAEGINTHYVVLAYSIELLGEYILNPDDQHDEMVWWNLKKLMATENVHQNTKNYFKFST